MIITLLLLGAITLQDDDATHRGQALKRSCASWVGNEGQSVSAETAILAKDCDSYVTGLADGLIVANRICVPDEVTNGQTAAVVLKFLNDHPERLHERRRTLASEALIRAFPCKGK